MSTLHSLSPFLRSAIWACLAALSFATMAVSVRYLDGKFDAFEVVFVRALIGLIIIIPLVSRKGFQKLKTTRMPMHFTRALFGTTAMAALYYALAAASVADVIALTFLIPIFTTIGAGLILHETIGRHRGAATLIGFLGTLVIIRPGFTEMSWPILLVILSSALYAAAWLCVKALTRTDEASVTVFWLNALMLPITIIPVIFLWVTPDWGDIIPLGIMALSGWSAHYCQARSFKNADASAIMPFDFLRLPIAAALGFILFAETLDAWSWIGAVIIFAAGYYITQRETKTGKISQPR
ncbi:MAG: DMT family transporter [Rhodospirillales bacterium]|nr:DMT family transporter [Rhodospirillales bacterium]